MPHRKKLGEACLAMLEEAMNAAYNNYLALKKAYEGMKEYLNN